MNVLLAICCSLVCKALLIRAEDLGHHKPQPIPIHEPQGLGDHGINNQYRGPQHPPIHEGGFVPIQSKHQQPDFGGHVTDIGGLVPHQGIGSQAPHQDVGYAQQDEVVHAPHQDIGGHDIHPDIGHGLHQDAGYNPHQDIGGHAPQQDSGYNALQDFGGHALPQDTGYAPQQDAGEHAPHQDIGGHSLISDIGGRVPHVDIGRHNPHENVVGYSPPSNDGGHFNAAPDQKQHGINEVHDVESSESRGYGGHVKHGGNHRGGYGSGHQGGYSQQKASGVGFSNFNLRPHKGYHH